MCVCEGKVLGPQWGFLPEFISLERGKEREEERREGKFVSFTNYPDLGPVRLPAAELHFSVTEVSNKLQGV